MKIILEFAEEERREALLAINARAYALFLEEVYQNLFRPLDKHGYPKTYERLNALADSHPEVDEALRLLQQMFFELRDELYNDLIDNC